MANPNPLDAMQKVFKEQHQQMIADQQKLLDGYKKYFDTMINQMEAQVNAMNPPEPPQLTEEEKIQKEIEEIRLLLDDAVKNYGKELTEIISELAERQKKKEELSSIETSSEKIN